MQPSADEAARTLRGIDRQRRVVRSSLPGWPLAMISLAIMTTFGLVQDLVPTWSGVGFLVCGMIALVLGRLGRSRRGSTMFGRLAQPRSFAQGTGIRPSSPARRLLVYGSYGILAVAVGTVVAYNTAHPTRSTGTWWPGGWPHTIEMLAIWAAVCGCHVLSRRWFAPGVAKS